MKRNVIIFAALCSTMLTYSQEAGGDEVVKNKKGNEILPKAGDIGLGFNAIPLMDAAINIIRWNQPVGASNTNANQFVQGANNQIVGKYFLSPKMAIRARIGMNTLSGTFVNQVQDAHALYHASLGTADDVQAAQLLRVEDKLKFSKSNILFTGGLEFRRGYRRLQGFYGAELGIGGTSARQSVTYGNAFSDEYPVTFTNNFNAFTTATQNPGTTRITRNLDARNRGGLRFGLRGFIGVEYFVFAKISVSAEYGWGYSITTRRGQTSTQEVYQIGQSGPTTFTEEVDTDTQENLKGFSVDNNSGTIFSMNNTLGGNTALNGGAGAISIIFHF
ncbi:MAG: hypothetical protein K0S32_2619 [Bacteroidetes bacterium]|jgi:hypothetical protein|nr:hypothetical protein [Bacteroidota bacterium]